MNVICFTDAVIQAHLDKSVAHHAATDVSVVIAAKQEAERIAEVINRTRPYAREVLVVVGLDTADLSRGRVMERVEAGGHDVPDEKIESRFPRTCDNLRQALMFVDEARLFDNSSSDHPFRFVAAFKNGKRQRRKGYVPAWAAFLG